MSKALIGIGDTSVTSNYPVAQQKGFSINGKSSPASRSSLISQNNSPLNKTPRNTHKHHRKPEASLSHLLNFSYDRPSQGSRPINPRKGTRATPSYGRGSGHHPLDKAHFVNANYRFVVHPSGDYRANLAESDIPIPWENVLQVLASIQSQCNACPICLEDIPVAPRMAKCGHIFCLPCALKYLSSEDVKTGKTTSKWRKCPICFDGVYANELRSVKWLSGDHSTLPVKGEDVTLQLIMRRTGSIFALPRDAIAFDDDVVPWHNQAEALEYARFVKGDAQYMETESQREVMDMIVMKERDAEDFGDIDEWTGTAIQFVEDRSTTYESMGLAPKIKSVQNTETRIRRRPIQYEVETNLLTASDIQTQSGRPDVPEEAVVDAYFFYQPRTGSHYYLSPLDIRILKRAFGAFSNFPSALIAKLEHASTTTVDEELRRRSKYLSHLPLGCEVTFLECDWTGVLAEDVLATFKIDVEKRRKKRHDKAITEETARRRAQAAEERRQRTGLSELQWHDDDTSYFARNDESNTYEVFAEAVPTSNASVSSGSLPNGSLERRSIWGTMLPPSQEGAAAAAAAETDEWKEQLEQFYQESAVAASLETGGTPGKKVKSKKKKLVLMSSGGGRGMG